MGKVQQRAGVSHSSVRPGQSWQEVGAQEKGWHTRLQPLGGSTPGINQMPP